MGQLVQFAFKSQALGAKLQPLCERVLSYFQRLPAYKLLCYIDDTTPNCLPVTHGSFSGLHVPVRGGGRWPDYVEEWFVTREHEFAFDNLIYIPGTKYISDPVAFGLILAHELRHFVQYGESEAASQANGILFGALGAFDPNAKVWDVPFERDAMIVSKQVIEAEFGTEAVQRLVERQISDAGASENSSKKELWIVFASLSSSAVYDWREATKQVVRKYGVQLAAALGEEDLAILRTVEGRG